MGNARVASRRQRADIAAETVAILHNGVYHTPAGRDVDIRAALAGAVADTVVYRPNGFPRPPAPPADGTTAFTVANETTLAAARRLVAADRRVLALNFASAKNPGGGF